MPASSPGRFLVAVGLGRGMHLSADRVVIEVSSGLMTVRGAAVLGEHRPAARVRSWARVAGSEGEAGAGGEEWRGA